MLCHTEPLFSWNVYLSNSAHFKKAKHLNLNDRPAKRVFCFSNVFLASKGLHSEFILTNEKNDIGYMFNFIRYPKYDVNLLHNSGCRSNYCAMKSMGHWHVAYQDMICCSVKVINRVIPVKFSQWILEVILPLPSTDYREDINLKSAD